MPRVVLTGGPGGGKTTLLAELAAMGHVIVDESARAIIAQRLARGASPRPAPPDFARKILHRDIEKYQRHPHTADWVFFDRGVVDALGMLHEVAPLPEDTLATMLATYRYHQPVFVLPPWQDIYTQDAERDQSFSEAVTICDKIVRWYRVCGYTPHELPRLPVAQRAAHVIRVLAETGS
jgi:predicted ATPase